MTKSRIVAFLLSAQALFICSVVSVVNVKVCQHLTTWYCQLTMSLMTAFFIGIVSGLFSAVKDDLREK